MNINFNNDEALKREFKQKLFWFEEEFDLIFKNKTHNYTLEDIKLANQILDKLSETINQYRNEKLLYPLVKALNNIEKKHPEFFKR
ncbi:MAG: hypothetical protein ACFFAH_03880 [Promethearchaeota archaeon]